MVEAIKVTVNDGALPQSIKVTMVGRDAAASSVVALQGARGPAGPAGPQGDTGPQGNPGSAGAVGATGATGATGPTGPAGNDGAAGAAGAVGATGPTGATGLQGDVGPAGSNGAAGATGPTGPTGPQGDAGPAGSNGADGAAGAQGPTGPTGPQGAVGAAGADGAEMLTFSHDDLSAVLVPFDDTATTVLKSVTIPANTLQIGSRIFVTGQHDGLAGVSGNCLSFATVGTTVDPYIITGAEITVESSAVFYGSAIVDRLGADYVLRPEAKQASDSTYSSPLDIASPIVISIVGGAIIIANDDLSEVSNFRLHIYGATAAAASVTSIVGPTGPTGPAGASPTAYAGSFTVPGDLNGRREHRETIALVGVTPSSVIKTWLAPALDTDENDPELIDLVTLVAYPGTDQFDILATFSTLHSGEIKFQYEVN